jgi:8-oxo-dGTP diphosphatase
MHDAPTPRGRSLAGIAVNDEGRLLIALRKPGGNVGGLWEFPGGKAEDGESDGDALEREYLEEFGVKIEVGQLLERTGFSSGKRLFSLSAYRIYPTSFDFTLTEHTEWKWASVDEIASSTDFVDSDLLLIPALRRLDGHFPP